MNGKDQEPRTADTLETKLLAALQEEPERMRGKDWKRLRARVRRLEAERRI